VSAGRFRERCGAQSKDISSKCYIENIPKTTYWILIEVFEVVRRLTVVCEEISEYGHRLILEYSEMTY
jgi:hypothetical protein